MLKWCKDLRIGEGVKKADKIRRKLNHGKIVPGVYLITFSENPRNLLEIIPALTIIQQSAADICPEIIDLPAIRTRLWIWLWRSFRKSTMRQEISG